MSSRFATHMLSIGTLVLAAGTLARAFPPPPQNTKDVNVVNTPNVNVVNTPNVNVTTMPPVTGNVAVTNTPTVNVGNTANVNVANTPTVQLSGTASVDVKNDSSAPVITRSADEPARHFFQKGVGFQVNNGDFGVNIDLGSVPANSTLVIEYISMQVRYPGNESTTAVTFSAGCCDLLSFAPVPTLSNTGTDSTWVVSQAVKMYVSAGTPMHLSFGRTSNVGDSQFGTVEISGYLVSQ